jgi:large subunit ribosomal protein L15
MDLSNLQYPEGARKKRTRVGRGPGSGKGKTCGRGEKGQTSRSGGSVPAWFEGGQMPLHRRIPKRGFKNRFAKEWAVVNLEDLEARFEAGAVVDANALAEKGLVRFRWSGEGEARTRVILPVKVLGRGEITKVLTVNAAKFSKSAVKAIVAAGGTAEVI